jgi:hypothetical protein
MPQQLKLARMSLLLYQSEQRVLPLAAPKALLSEVPCRNCYTTHDSCSRAQCQGGIPQS